MSLGLAASEVVISALVIFEAVNGELIISMTSNHLVSSNLLKSCFLKSP